MTAKLKVTAQQRANALEALNVMWPSVPPENVCPKLAHWRLDYLYNDTGVAIPSCGTICCFGGWAEWWPPFRTQMGLSSDHGLASWNEVVGLFGKPSDRPIDKLLAPRGSHHADVGFAGNDHELVTNRLKWLIENSEVAE